MSDEHDSEIEFSTILFNDWLQLAQETWKQDNSAISITKTANMHEISKSMLQNHIHDTISKIETSQNMQQLSSDEEEVLADWMPLLTSWDWPVKIEQLCDMICELLQTKNDIKELEIHWMKQFLKCHFILKSKYVTELEKDHVVTEDSDIIKIWFELMNYHITKNAVQKKNIHNMNEKDVMMRVTEKMKIIISKNEKKQYMTASDSWEWVSLIECISVIEEAQNSWIIFKDKIHKISWMQILKSDHIVFSETGWTDNELELTWLKNCFESRTVQYDDNDKWWFQILIFDDHVSHISIAAICFCIKTNIIILCLFWYFTHFLQFLNVEVFSFYAHYYKKKLLNCCYFDAHYSVNKIIFLKILQNAQAQVLTEKIIQKTWKKSDLFFSDLKIVLQKLLIWSQFSTSISNQTSSLIFVALNDEIFQAALTLRNMTEIKNFMKWVLKDETFDSVIILQIKKFHKIAVKTIADTIIQSSTNEKLLIQLKKHKKRKVWTNEQLADYDRYLESEILKECTAKHLQVV